MTRYIQEGPMWRRALVSMAAMVGISATFVAVVMLVLGSIVDLAVSTPASDDKEAGKTETVDKAKSNAAPSPAEPPMPTKTKTHEKPGEQS